MIISPQRSMFDIPRDVCYLNASYMTPLLNSQRMVGERALTKLSHPWEVGTADFFNTAEDVRSLGAQLMGATADDIAIVPAAGYGTATAAKNLPLTPGQKILLLSEEFPANVYDWQALAARNGGSVVFVPTPRDHDWTAAILDCLEREGEQISIVALGNVHWSSGAVIDLMAVSHACKKLDAALALDLSQSLGAMPVDLKAVDPDFAVAAGYKWLLAPYGISLMYVAPRWQEKGVALEEGWIGRKDSENFAGLVNYRADYQPGARRFDMGERASFALLPILAEGLRQLLDWGVPNIANSLQAINDRLVAVLADVGAEALPADRRAPHMQGVRVGAKGPDLMKALQAAKVFTSLRGEMLRLSPHLWVDERDEALFADVLKKIF